jgi:vacuolar-type H+-ATPase subunit I/STV1
VALDAAVPLAARQVLGLLGASMWLRGLAELYMLYVSKNWRPPYGIGHDVLCLGLVLGTLAWHQEHWAGPLTGEDAWALALVGLVLASLVIEIVYAALFFHAVEGATVGEQGIWFADEEQARFRRINRLTFLCNLPMYGALAALLCLGFGLRPS